MSNRKALSPILGMAMMFILILVSFTAVLWQIRQMDATQQEVNFRNEEDTKRMEESIEIIQLKITTENRLNCTVLNKSPTTVKFVDFFVIKYNLSTPMWEKIYSLNSSAYPLRYTLNPGMTTTNIGTGDDVPLIVNASDTYSVRVVTERGTSALAVYVHPPTEEKKIGPLTFSLDYLSFNYTTDSDETYYRSHSRSAWEMVGGKDKIIWWVKLTNHGYQNISINSCSYLMIYVPYSDSGEDEHYFYIVDNSSISGNLIGYSTPLLIPANVSDQDTGVSRILKFGSKTKDGTLDKMLTQPVDNYNNFRRFLYAGFIGLSYQWSEINQTYALHIPLSTQKVLPFWFSVNPLWVNPVSRPVSGTLRIFHTYNLKSYQFSRTVRVSVNMISGPGTISYQTGPWDHSLNYGTNITSPQRYIDVTSSTALGTYKFEVSFTYTTSFSTTFTKELILIVS